MTQAVIDFAQQNLAIIIMIIVLLVFAFVYPQKAKEIAKKKAKDFIFLAEKNAKDYLLRSGYQKFSWVARKAYVALPTPVKLFVSEKLFEELIQEAYDEMMDLIDDGKNNDSYQSPKNGG